MGVSIVAVDCLQTFKEYKSDGGAEIASILTLASLGQCLDSVSQLYRHSYSELHHDIFHISPLGLERPHLWYIVPHAQPPVNRFP